MSVTRPVRILYMEDDPGLARLFQKKLRRAGYIVDIARDGAEGLQMCVTGSYDVIATDQAMPVHNGLEVIRILATQGPLPPTIMVTGTGSEQIAVEAMKLGASDYIVKDVDGGYLDLLPAVIERVLQQQRLLQEKQETEDALRQYTAELEARNEELDAFAHTVAHDLKGPLGPIVGFAQVLANEHATLPEEELRKHLLAIARHGKRMGNIIDELLLLSSMRKLEEVELEPLDMACIVADAQERLGYLIEKHQVKITLPEAWPIAIGHGPWVEEVWVNYLSNAIRYGGHPPHIELGATLPEKPVQQIRFWVRDNGNGLTPEEQERLFTPFTRLDQTRAKGHGLGLSIVRRIVERLRGQVGVESEIGAGSTFWFTLSPGTT
jgi:two-component system sensor histidine kinase/response regulator